MSRDTLRLRYPAFAARICALVADETGSTVHAVAQSRIEADPLYQIAVACELYSLETKMRYRHGSYMWSVSKDGKEICASMSSDLTTCAQRLIDLIDQEVDAGFLYA